MNPHLQGRLETQGRTDVAAWVWRQFGDKIPSYLGNLYFFFSLGLQLIWWGPPTSRTNTQKRCPSHYKGLECKSRKSRNSWSNRQILPWSTEWSTAKAKSFANELVRENTLFQQHKTLHTDITRWSILKSDWLYSLQPKMEKLYTVSKNKTRSWWWLRSWAPYCQIQTEIEESRKDH